MSVVVADEWADWSLLPLERDDEKEGGMTVVMEREREKGGEWSSVLRILMVGPDGEKTPIREVTWAFHGIGKEEEVCVGMYAAKPTRDERENLLVDFEGFELEMGE